MKYTTNWRWTLCLNVVALTGVLSACQMRDNVQGNATVPKLDYCQHIASVDYNFYEVLAFSPNYDIQDTIIADTPILDKNPFKSIELIPSEFVDDAFDFFIRLNDKRAKDWHNFTKNNMEKHFALVVDGKIIEIIPIGYELSDEFVMTISDTEMTYDAFNQLKSVNCQYH